MATVRSLPVLQHWDCQGCSTCCREYTVHVTPEEKTRIEAQGWDGEPALAGLALLVRVGGRDALAQRADGACVFLDEANRCRIHGKHGSAAKPLACRVYPFVLVPAGTHWRVGLRYACPSAAGDRGRALADHADDLRDYARGLERETDPALVPAPPLQPGQNVPWADLHLFAQALGSILKQSHLPLERRLRLLLALASLCRKATFDSISGSRLAEFLNLVGAGLEADVPADPTTLPPPGWLARLLFRQSLALYARKDRGPERGDATRTFWGRTRAVWRFAVGTGTVPRIHAALPEVTFAQIEATPTDFTDGSTQLERYFRVKVDSLQFAGKTNFGAGFWDGLEALVFTFPLIAWLRRAFAAQPSAEAWANAIRIVDDSFGFNPLLGTARQRYVTRVLAGNGQLAALVARYGRPAS